MNGDYAMGKIKHMIICIAITGSIIIFSFLSVITGKVCIFYKGFAIDGNGNLYIGKNYAIEVLGQDGSVLRQISPYTSRGYRFTIEENNTILIDTGDFLYRTDLSGNLKESKEIHGDGLSVSVLHKYVSANGTVYRMKSRLLRPYIVRMDGAERVQIYKMPAFDYTVKLLSVISFPVFLVSIALAGTEMKK